MRYGFSSDRGARLVTDTRTSNRMKGDASLSSADTIANVTPATLIGSDELAAAQTTHRGGL